jgi:hypothetical protein
MRIEDFQPRKFDLEDYSFIEYYMTVLENLKKMSIKQRHTHESRLCLTDRYYLLRYCCNMGFLESPYMYTQCKFIDDIKFNRGGLDGWIIVWFREGGKSTIANIGENIQNILTDPNKSNLVFSHSAKSAKKFILEPVIGMFENNEKLKKLYPNVLYRNPQREAKLWSIDGGYIFKRSTNRIEPTLFAAGIDAPPTGSHFDNICDDDIVAEQTVQTDDRMAKTIDEYQHTLSIGRNIDLPNTPRSSRWYIDTIYDGNDCSCFLIDSGEYKVDLLPWHNGDRITPLAHSYEGISKLRGKMSPYIFSCQYECNPIAASKRKFPEFLHHYDRRHEAWNHIGICDPAGGFKTKRDHDPDRTAMSVVGRDELSNEYLVDSVYDCIDLRTRIKKMFDFTRKYKIKEWHYEKASMNADINEIERWMAKTGIYFELIPYIPVDNKEYRIERDVISRVANGILKFPKHLYYTNAEGQMIDVIDDVMKVEMKAFPAGKRDDFLDHLAQLGATSIYGNDSEPTPETRAVHKPRNPKKAAIDTLDSLDDVPVYI